MIQSKTLATTPFHKPFVFVLKMSFSLCVGRQLFHVLEFLHRDVVPEMSLQQLVCHETLLYVSVFE